MNLQRGGRWLKSARGRKSAPICIASDATSWCGSFRNSSSSPSSCISSSVEGWTVSPRKSRRKSRCFSSTTTSTPARASRKPSIMPAGPPPAMQQVVLICSMRQSRSPDQSQRKPDSRLFKPRRHVLVLAFKLHAGGQRHGFHQGGEILLDVFIGIGLSRRRAEMGLQHFARRRSNRHRHVPIAAKAEAEIHVLAQELRRERGGPV